MVIELNENESRLVLVADAIDYYISQICAGDVDGDDSDLECLSNVFIQINNSL